MCDITSKCVILCERISDNTSLFCCGSLNFVTSFCFFFVSLGVLSPLAFLCSQVASFGELYLKQIPSLCSVNKSHTDVM